MSLLDHVLWQDMGCNNGYGSKDDPDNEGYPGGVTPKLQYMKHVPGVEICQLSDIRGWAF